MELFNRSWNEDVRSIWKKAIIVPILKKNKPNNQLDSYRPISLTSVLAKTMERMVTSRLVWFLEKNSLLSSSQAGFRSYHSTAQQVIYFSQTVKDGFDNRNSTLAVFVDLKSAYDRVWRVKLIQKLQCCGITGNMLCWIKNFITQRFIKVRFGDCLSSFKQTETGLPQGAVISPILFNVYINDLPDFLSTDCSIKSALFADDLVLWSSAPKLHQQLLNYKLNESLERLDDWCGSNNMTVNIDKTTCQFFTLNRQPFLPQLFYRGFPINICDNTTYLGCTLDKRLNWKEHVTRINKKAERRLFLLKRLAGCKWGCGRNTLITTYKMYIKPVFTYCNEVLVSASDSVIDKLEKTQNQAMRLITGAVKSTPIAAMQLLTKLPPVKYEIHRDSGILLQKLCRLPGNSYWRNYDYNKQRNLKTQHGFNQVSYRIAKDIDIIREAELLVGPWCPLDFCDCRVSLDLDMPIDKRNMSDTQIRAIALATIENRYPVNRWTYVYTDGSMFQRCIGAGAGVFCEHFAFYKAVGRDTTSFDGELEAILIALRQIMVLRQNFSNVVILSDSRSALQAISNNKVCDSKRLFKCRSLLKSLADFVVLQWVPSHCGVEGNERADYLAKKGTTVLQRPNQPLTFHSAKILIKLEFERRFDSNISILARGKAWECLLNSGTSIPDLPRSSAVASFRLLTGHDCLNAHLYKIRLKDSPACCFCDSGHLMDSRHIDVCPALKDFNCIIQKYWEARRLMT